MKGRLKEIPLAWVFLQLYRSREEGVLHVAWEGRVKVFYLKDGRIRQAISNATEENPVRILIEHGFISENAFKSLVARKQEGEFELLLLDSGILTRTDMKKAFRLRVEKMVSNALRWEDGDFFFFKEKLPSYLNREEGLDIKEVVRKSIYSTEDRRYFLRYLKNMDQWLVATGEKEELDEREQEVLKRFSKPTSIRRAIQSLPYDEFHSLKVIFFLKMLGLLKETLPSEEVEEIEEDVVEVQEEPEETMKEAVEPRPAPSKRRRVFLRIALIFLLLLLLSAAVFIWNINVRGGRSRQTAQVKAPVRRAARTVARRPAKPAPPVRKKPEKPGKEEKPSERKAPPSPWVYVEKGDFKGAALRWKEEFKGKRGYTIFLELDCQPSSVKTALRYASRDRFFMLPFRFRGRTCYRLFWGLFPDLKSAEREFKGLPSYYLKQGAKIFYLENLNIRPAR